MDKIYALLRKIFKYINKEKGQILFVSFAIIIYMFLVKDSEFFYNAVSAAVVGAAKAAYAGAKAAKNAGEGEKGKAFAKAAAESGVKQVTGVNNVGDLAKKVGGKSGTNAVKKVGNKNKSNTPPTKNPGGGENNTSGGEASSTETSAGNVSSEDGGGAETESDSTGSASTKSTKKVVIFGAAVLAAIIVPFTIFLLPTLMLFGIRAQTRVVNGFSCDGNTTSIVCGLGKGINNFYEISKNFVLYGKFASNSDILVKTTNQVYEKFYNEYNVKIDVPLVLATILADGEVYPDDHNDLGGTIDFNSNLRARYKSIEAAALLQLDVYETTYECTLDDEGNPSMQAISRAVYEEEDFADTGVCGTTNVGKHVYRYSYQLNLDGYYDKLAENKDIILDIYEDTLPEDYTDEDLDLIIDKIKLKKNTFDIFYGIEEDECANPGNIPSYLLTDSAVNLQTPLKGSYNITSYFGLRTLNGKADNHKGIDVVGSNTIYAAGDGVVTKARWEIVGGYVVEVKHVASDGRIFYSQYGHLDSMSVKKGDTVVAGKTVIGIMGATGTGAKGVHLHFQFWEILADGEEQLYNPLTIFVAAENYIYQCLGTSVTDDTCVSTSGSVAYLSEQYGYNYYLLKAIFAVDGVEDTSKTKNDINLASDFNKYLQTKYQTGTFEQKDVIAKINAVDEIVYLDSQWVSYAGDETEDYEIRARMIEMLGEVDPYIYEHIFMGISQIQGNEYKTFSYNSAEEMYEKWSDSHHTQVVDAVYYITQVLGLSGSLADTGDLSKSELQTIALTLASKIYGNDNPYATNKPAKNIVYYYNYYQTNGPTPTLALNDCTSDEDIIEYEERKGEQCEMYVNYGACVKNIEKYDNDSYWGRFLKQAGTSLMRIRLLSVAHEYWGYVRYCNSYKSSHTSVASGNLNCKMTGIHDTSEFDPVWSTLIGPETGDVLGGLDCAGFITRVFITFVRRYYDETYDAPYAFHSGYCEANTDYTTYYKFGKGNFASYFSDPSHTLKPGDLLCASNEHVMMFIGWDDDNNNEIWDLEENMYFMHTGSSEAGVAIDVRTYKNIDTFSARGKEDDPVVYDNYVVINDQVS